MEGVNEPKKTEDRIINFISSLKAIKIALDEKIKTFKEAAKDIVSKDALDELDETISQLDDLLEDTKISQSVKTTEIEKLKTDISGLQSQIVDITDENRTTELIDKNNKLGFKIKALQDTLNKLESQSKNGGKRKTKKQKKSKKNRTRK
jgi:preprotein translocase subunit SecD